MSLDLDDVAEGIATALRTIPTLTGRTFDHVPERVSPPCAVVAMGTGDWEDFSDSERVEWRILLLVSLASARDAQDRLRAYLNATGAESVLAALTADPTLGGACSSIGVGPWDEPATVEIGAQDYQGVVVNVVTV